MATDRTDEHRALHAALDKLLTGDNCIDPYRAKITLSIRKIEGEYMAKAMASWSEPRHCWETLPVPR
jgi:hypothetical protein